MNYPVWEVSFGSQWVIAFIAVIHVFISHFAIGGGLFLVAIETRAHRHDDSQLLAWLRGHTKFFLLLTVVAGALTGVGIWFTIGIVSPEATSTLIHMFVWAWAIEWVFFLVEITAILVYARTWDTLPRATHRAIGWLYFAAAWLSLAAINGILSFMLTPGRWLVDGSLWAAFFNPGYLPSLAIRSLICIVLAGVYALFSASFLKDRQLKAEISRYASHWVWMPALLLVPSAAWYLHTIPQAHRNLFSLDAYLHGFLIALLATSALLIALSSAVRWLSPSRMTKPMAGFLMLLAFGAFGATEWVREDLRKPFIIAGTCWANQIPVRQEATIRATGILKSAVYVTDTSITPKNRLHAGKQIYRISCGPCHRPRHGFNALRPRLAGTDATFAAALVLRSGLMRGAMPPFLGIPEEADAVAAYLLQGAPPPRVNPSGEAVFRSRCWPCHDLHGTFRPISGALSGMDAAALAEFLKALSSDKMPAWSGPDPDLKVLADHLARASADERKSPP